MKKTLNQIDPVYNSVTDYMTVSDRIAYCESLIMETDHFLVASACLIDEKTKDKYEEIILAAQKELQQLARSKPEQPGKPNHSIS